MEKQHQSVSTERGEKENEWKCCDKHMIIRTWIQSGSQLDWILSNQAQKETWKNYRKHENSERERERERAFAGKRSKKKIEDFVRDSRKEREAKVVGIELQVM